MTQRTFRKDVVGISSLNVDYFYESEDLSFLEPFYPEGGYRRQWVLTDSEEIEKAGIRRVEGSGVKQIFLPKPEEVVHPCRPGTLQFGDGLAAFQGLPNPLISDQ
jgi:hypothetical protein